MATVVGVVVIDHDTLIAALPRTVSEADKAAWATNPSAVLEAYAVSEGF